ncbi:MAG: hypothetical protein P8011_00605 [Acidihalobacter sp.]|jgi:UDP-N-acetylglucosamine:LPS N-acetylglucosamine transferase|uniref:hypothetical protein n=1 Tax=Acidihalobacter sp. TaxID=1872108 RepID=UPI00307F3853
MTGKILSVLSGAGFTYETTKLLQPIATHSSFVFLTTEHGGTPGSGEIPMGECHLVPSFPTVTNPSKINAIKAVWRTFVLARRVMRVTQPDMAVVVGCSHAVPVFVAARTVGLSTVFVESITRSDQLSMTGRLVRALRLADLFIVQWPELQRRNVGTQLGSIL